MMERMNANVKTSQSTFSRRRLLRRAGLAAAAAWAAPAVVPSSVMGAFAPSNRIHVAEIGMGNQSQVDLPAFLRQPDAQVVAVCDVNTGSRGYKTPEQFLGRKPGQDRVNAYYAKQTGIGSYKGCDAYNDFREVLARADVDAVVLVVPDHWHAVMTVMAAAAGKDIYCEKPLSLTVRDGQEMVKAVRRHKRVLQTGSMKTTKFRPDEIRLPVSVPGREMVLTGRQQMQGSSLNVDHARNFLDCVKSRQDPVEPAEAGHRTASLCHLANIAMRLRRKIRWDPQHEDIRDDDEARRMLSRPMRSPWTM